MKVFEQLKTPESLERVRKIAGEIWPETFRKILSEEQIRYMMTMMYSPSVMEGELSSGYIFEILVIDGKDAGYMVYAPYDDSGTMKLHKLYLLGEYHGKGYGQEMLSHVKERSSGMGYRSLILAVNKRNAKAIKAYKRFGFEVEESVKIDIGSGFYMDDFRMRCNLVL